MEQLDSTCKDVNCDCKSKHELSTEESAQIYAAQKAEEEELSLLTPAQPILPQPGIPKIPLPELRKNTVSGRYRGTNSINSFELELRVDVDSNRPMYRVSGDFYRRIFGILSYYGSFTVDSFALFTVTSTTVTIQGTGSFSFGIGTTNVRVTIPRTNIFQSRAAATVQFITTGSPLGPAYSCQFISTYFRTVRYEQDQQQGVTPFVSYNTGSLPSGGPARTLAVVSSYAESGIEFQTVPATDIVPTAEAGTNLLWSDSELHASMVSHFSLWANIPQWCVWLIAAYAHEEGPGLYGIMFDQIGKQRQGCATFHQGIGGATADKLRLQLYCYVHELGHCFNLLHSWQKHYAVPPVPDRPSSRSWMNYPWNYPGGASAFWSGFPFIFDDQEIIHLRHAFRHKIIMGGNNFAVGSALEDPQAFAPPIEDNSGLQLELEAPKSFAYGEPVVVEIKLRTTDMRGKKVYSHIHPKTGLVKIGIRKPDGKVMLYEPLIEHCVIPDEITLDMDRPSIYDSAYIGYGKDGFYFDQTGNYKICATYNAPDGSEVVSNIINVRVRTPLSSADDEVADLFYGDDQGTILYLLGSDSEFLKGGNEAFDMVLDKYGDHPLSVYARLVKGINAGRTFKTISPEYKIEARNSQPEQSISLLTTVVDASKAKAGVDNITLNMTMRSMARIQQNAGDDSGAKATMDQMVNIFSSKGLKKLVLEYIIKQAEEALKQ